MMMNKRLIAVVSESKKYIGANVLFQWIALLANIALMTAVTTLLALLLAEQAEDRHMGLMFLIAVAAVVVRLLCNLASARMSYLSSRAVKSTLREKIYEKLLRLGVSYREQVKTSEVVQVAVEGVDQLETYFGAYLPQFFYAMLAPLTLFVYLCFIHVPAAVLLLLCVPLIPVAIAAVQTWAKKLLAKYWGQYTAMGDTFLENLQGLTTLKIYQADEWKQQRMNEEAEKFRKITMKVLTMQLNSITIMDLIAYGGAALGVILSVTRFARGNITLAGALLIILLAAEFFIPMRQLGSFFHIAMNGMAASDKIFKLLDLPEEEKMQGEFPEDCGFTLENVSFSYEAEREILKNLSLTIQRGSFTAFVGESGSGKSTLASVLRGKNHTYSGKILVGRNLDCTREEKIEVQDGSILEPYQAEEKMIKNGKNADVEKTWRSQEFLQSEIELRDISKESLLKHITYVGHQSYLFRGTVEENLRMGNPFATEEELWAVLERVQLSAFLKSEQGLATRLAEKASNLSGGQCQRLALARALLFDSPVYIFDEATSNIDVESENLIMKEIHRLAKTKTVILISHRLANVAGADNIYVLEKGAVAERGNHEALLNKKGLYFRQWNAQQRLEQYGKDGAAA